jgi:glycogen phosphorylase
MATLPMPQLPNEIADLQSLALDLRWTWSHGADALWAGVDKGLWERTRNPWTVLQLAPAERLKLLAADAKFREQLANFVAERRRYLETPGWFRRTEGASRLGGVAYLSMEFGLGAALPLYAGGLGILAGDFLKTASDLDVPIIGVGLLYQEGYFRQFIDNSGGQQEFYPYNEPATMPIERVILPDGSWLRVEVDLPGRTVQLRVWQATVGRVKLYLLDSNNPLNGPRECGITTKLYDGGKMYGGGPELRLMQEIVLGVGGWRVVEALHPNVDICHVNEGHAAFAIIERACHLAQESGLTFWEALWATRAGNVFTTHTPVAAGFDKFPTEILRNYLRPYVERVVDGRGVNLDVKPDKLLDDILKLGRSNPHDPDEPFNMAFLAQRGSAVTIAVSRLHGEVSRMIFSPLFKRWPQCEVPVIHVTNGVHIPTWDSVGADQIWTKARGKDRWLFPPQADGADSPDVSNISDAELWAMRGAGRLRVVEAARADLTKKMRERGYKPEVVKKADKVLDPNVLTLGFARRFTEYKRPNLLLSDLNCLDRLLHNKMRPVQIVLAGKAHPDDHDGKRLIQQWINLARRPEYRQQIVFIEDYDISVAQELVQGVDVWINTPRRPWEACGTSGMKVLVNGGLNCSTLDGWWDEAYDPSVGWSIGDGSGGEAKDVDVRDAASLYDILENKIIPEFYDRGADGLPHAWIDRIRRSTSKLTPVFGGARMIHDYVEKAYLPLAKAVHERLKDKCAQAKAMNQWSRTLHSRWQDIHIDNPTITQSDATTWQLKVSVLLGEIAPGSVRVELFAAATAGFAPEVILLHQEHAIPGSINGYIFAGEVASSRPLGNFTVRVVPYHPNAFLPAELPLIAWQH